MSRYNQANGQTTYQMGQTYGGGYNANTMVPGQIPPVQPPMYPQPIPQVKYHDFVYPVQRIETPVAVKYVSKARLVGKLLFAKNYAPRRISICDRYK